MSALSSGKIDKYEYQMVEEILPPQYHRRIEPAKLNYSPLGKVFEKQRKTVEEQGGNKLKPCSLDGNGLHGSNYLFKVMS